MTVSERLAAMQAHQTELEAIHAELRDRLDEATGLQAELRAEAARLKEENEMLKGGSLYLATVEELSDEQAIIRQHGNNQEVLTEVRPQLASVVEAGDRVAIDDSFTVQLVMDVETDARAQAMEIQQSPDVVYDDIGGLDEQIREVREAVEDPLVKPELFTAVGVEPPAGVLLYGPPGTGKTMLAKAVANETDATFIKMAGSELVRKFIGEGARLVRDLFALAANREPAVIFIDEIDAVASKRTDSKTSGDAEVQRTMMQLLAEMDGFDERGEIRLIAATNRFDMLDEAILRPGRFDRLIEVPKPEAAGREEILRIHTAKMQLSSDVDLHVLAARFSSFSGADLAALATEAGMFAIREGRTEVCEADFDAAHEKIDHASQPTTIAGPAYHR
jgi:proteasome regulatory subunit